MSRPVIFNTASGEHLPFEAATSISILVLGELASVLERSPLDVDQNNAAVFALAHTLLIESLPLPDEDPNS